MRRTGGMTLRVYRLNPATGETAEVSHTVVRRVDSAWSYADPALYRWPPCRCPVCLPTRRCTVGTD